MSQNFKYVITNLVNSDTLDSVSSEDPVYVQENLYNVRPSFPFRFTGLGSVGNPEWICVEFPIPRKLTFVGLFNTNFVRNHHSDVLKLKGCDTGCGSGGCNWDAPDFELNLLDRWTANHLNLYSKLAERRLGWRLDVINSRNPDSYLEIGDYVLGNWSKFSKNVHLQPGRDDGPVFEMGNQRTYYGQDWTNYRSESEQFFEMKFVNTGDVQVVDEFKVFLTAVMNQGGKFVLIPDDSTPFAYYVMIVNMDDFARRVMYGLTGEVREWDITLKTLTEGIVLI